MTNRDRSPLTPPLKWHGGKQYLANRLVALMPPHLHYVEPYFGGGAVLLEKDPDGVSEVVGDMNGDLTNFWKVLQGEQSFREFSRIVEATPFSEHEWWLSFHSQTHCHGPVKRAAAFFVCCRQSLAGRMDCFAPLSRTRTRRGMNEQASAWLGAVEGLAAVHARLKRVVIRTCDALELIRSQDGADTLFYLDPPYIHRTRATTGEYLHEMSDDQHEALLDDLEHISGNFLLSGYRSNLYDERAEANGWRRVDFDLPNNAAGGSSKRRMTECVWMNYSEDP